jgi:hypothetical protein
VWQGEFKITPAVLKRVEYFDVIINGEKINKNKIINFQEALELLIDGAGRKTYRIRNDAKIKDIALRNFYLDVHYRDIEKPVSWKFWQVMKYKDKQSKNIAFQKLRARRVKNAVDKRMRRFKNKEAKKNTNQVNEEERQRILDDIFRTKPSQSDRAFEFKDLC